MSDGADQEDRTEEPTRRKLDEAVKRGDVARSAELGTFFVLGALTLGLMLTASTSARTLLDGLRGYLSGAHLLMGPGALEAAGKRALGVGLDALLLPIGMCVVAALAASFVQHRPLWTFEPLMPQFSRLSPMTGLKRVLGKEALVQFVKGLLKIGIVGTLAGVLLWRERDRLESFAFMPPALLLGATLGLALKLLLAIMAFHAVIAVGDAVYQRFSWTKRQRMSKHEVKQEMKEQDGNPEIKAKIRQLRAQRVRKRMMAAVPQATVVLANPTHFAVALRYESGMQAPVCVAKGVDALALRIRAVAEEHGVTVVENPPLARALHAVVEIDDVIPVEHYKAVAEVIGYVLRLKRRAA